MKHLLPVFFALSFSVLRSGAQSVSTLSGARSAGFANASATLGDEWTMLNNVGGISHVKSAEAAFAQETRPGLMGANRIASSFLVPFKQGTAGLALFRFGDNLYSEQIISMGYGNQFGLASLGLKVNFIQYRADGWGTRNAVSLNFGGIARITPSLQVGAYIVNLNQPRISGLSPERLPTKLVAGIGWKAGDPILLVAEVEKDLSYQPTLRCGAEYQFNRNFAFRTGYSLQPNQASFGLGYHWRQIRIDYAFQYSNMLSSGHQASLVCRLKKRNTTTQP